MVDAFPCIMSKYLFSLRKPFQLPHFELAYSFQARKREPYYTSPLLAEEGAKGNYPCFPIRWSNQEALWVPLPLGMGFWHCNATMSPSLEL